jgi:hypothetical protein
MTPSSLLGWLRVGLNVYFTARRSRRLEYGSLKRETLQSGFIPECYKCSEAILRAFPPKASFHRVNGLYALPPNAVKGGASEAKRKAVLPDVRLRLWRLAGRPTASTASKLKILGRPPSQPATGYDHPKSAAESQRFTAGCCHRRYWIIETVTVDEPGARQGDNADSSKRGVRPGKTQ